MSSSIPSGLIPGPCPVTVKPVIPAPGPGTLGGGPRPATWKLRLEFNRPSTGATEVLQVFIAPGGTFPRNSGASLTYDRVVELFNERAAENYPINIDSRRFILKYMNPGGQINLRFLEKDLDILPLPADISTYFLDLLIITGSGTSYKIDTLLVTSNDYFLESQVTLGTEAFFSSPSFIGNLATSIATSGGIMLAPGLAAQHSAGTAIVVTLAAQPGGPTTDVVFEARTVEIVDGEEVLGTFLSPRIVAPRRVTKSINLSVGGSHTFNYQGTEPGRVGFVAIVRGQHSNPAFLDVPD